MNLLYLIPARGGSKRIPNKNIKPLNGKPLIFYTIDAAKELSKISNICISTDSIEIKKIVENYGVPVPFLRPKNLAKDTSGMHEVILHALDFFKLKGKIFDAVVLLQPTSPLRQAKHINEALKLFSTNIDMIVSVKNTKANPYFDLFEEDKNGFLKKSKSGDYIRRQDCPEVWQYNGAIYIINVNSIMQKSLHHFIKIVKYKMDDYSSIDIDNKLDFYFAGFIMDKLNK